MQLPIISGGHSSIFNLRTYHAVLTGTHFSLCSEKLGWILSNHGFRIIRSLCANAVPFLNFGNMLHIIKRRYCREDSVQEFLCLVIQVTWQEVYVETCKCKIWCFYGYLSLSSWHVLHGILHFLHTAVQMVPHLGHDHFLPIFFNFIICEWAYYCALCSLSYRQYPKKLTKNEQSHIQREPS
jgi:hypothetical protein